MSIFGLVVPEDIWSARSEQFFNQVLAGIEDVVVAGGHSVLTQASGSIAQEDAILRRWAEDGAVSAVVLRDLQEEDARPALMEELGLPYVLIGDLLQEPGTGAGSAAFSTVTVENAGIMREVLSQLIALGHRSIAHVGGPQHLVHSALRRAAYREVMAQHGLEDLSADGDYSRRSGGEALMALRDRLAPGGAIVLDNDAMALGALDRAHELGVRVPADVSLVSWEDSMGCQLSDPPLTALGHTLRATGRAVGEALTLLVEDPPRPVHIRRPMPVLLRRASLAAPPADG